MRKNELVQKGKAVCTIGTYLGKLTVPERWEGCHRQDPRFPGPEGSTTRWECKSDWLDVLGWLEGSRIGKYRWSWALSAGAARSSLFCCGGDDQKGRWAEQKGQQPSSSSAVGRKGSRKREGPRGQREEGPGEFERSLAPNKQGNKCRRPRVWRTFETTGQCSGLERLPGRWAFG